MESLVIDIESTGLQYKKDTLTSFVIYDSQIEDYFTLDDLPTSQHNHGGIAESLQSFINGRLDSHRFIFHNAKFDLRMMEIKPSIVDRMDIIDTTILAQYINPRGSNALGNLEIEYFGTDVKSSYHEKYGKDFTQWPKEELLLYNKVDVEITYRLYSEFMPKVPTKFLSYQTKLLKALYRIEYSGFPYDSKKASEVRDIFENDKNRIYNKMLEELKNSGIDGTGINFNSSKQVSILIYEDLGINRPDRNNYPAGKAYDKLFTSTMTNKQLLKTLHSDFVSLYLDHSSTVSTLRFIKTYSDLEIDNRLYPNFNITGTITGRLSCSKPNLQNIKKGSINDFSLRSLFIPEKDQKLVSIDYQQQEIRVLAILSQDKNLLSLVDQGEDMHLAVAKTMMGREEVTKEERDVFKNLHFGMLYGLSPSAIAFNLGNTIEETYQLLDDYYDQFPDVKLWMDDVISEVEFSGEITLFTGRKWYSVPYAAYQGINAYVQGTAAEITNMATIRINEYLKKNKSGSILSIIHDEFLLSLSDTNHISNIVNIMEIEKLFGHKFLTDVEISESY